MTAGGPGGGSPPPEGTWIGVIVSGFLLVGSVGACLVTGLAAAEARESDAVMVSMVTVPTLIAGLFPWIVALLTRQKGVGLAVGAPIGCGCLTWVASLIGLVVFYQVIWPEL